MQSNVTASLTRSQNLLLSHPPLPCWLDCYFSYKTEVFKSASWETACPFQPRVNIRVPGAAPGSTFPSLSVPGSDHDSTSPGACSRPVLQPWRQTSPVQMLGGEGKSAPPRGRCGQERRQEQLSARSSC